jgi:hypothetical protein
MSLKQQTRLYEAEKCLWDHGRVFNSIREVGEYLQDITKSDYFVSKFGWIPPIEIRNFSSRSWAGCADRHQYIIYLKRMNENVVLHELAHLLSSCDEHDHEFTGNLMFLVREFMGFNAFAEFSQELDRVEYFNA